MVQARENLSAITGTVRSVGPHPELDGWDLVELELTAKEPVDGYADLLDARAGDTVRVGVRRAVLGTRCTRATSCAAACGSGGGRCWPRTNPTRRTSS